MSELWRPSEARIAGAELVRFARTVSRERGVDGIPAPDADRGSGRDLGPGSDLMERLHAWSIDDPRGFWRAVWDFSDVAASAPPVEIVDDPSRMPGAEWFEGARLNFAENLLRPGRPDADALVSWNEHGHVRTLSRAALRAEVARAAEGLRDLGVGTGDRVAGFVPNVVEAVIGMLAASSLGAVWTACSTDFGVEGALDRFRQVEPSVLIAGTRATWKGQWQHTGERVAGIATELVDLGLEAIVLLEYGLDRADQGGDPAKGEATSIRAHLPDSVNVSTWMELTRPGSPVPEPRYEQLPFDHPLYILYSSGTTGPPKCMIHGQGGTLLQHAKELRLHTDVRAGDRIFYYTTCGWMMWNWLVSALSVGATVVLWDGSPLAPDATAMWDLVARERVTHFGTSAKYLAVAEKRGLRPSRTHDLLSLRTILSTGSPLLPSSFDWVYSEVKPDVHLASISGGTDIVSCFLLGDPTGPVYRGELQTAGLGMRVEVWDEDGHPRPAGVPGELVCSRAFPSMPVGFVGDPHGARYRSAYFEYFSADDAGPGGPDRGHADATGAVWRHGDWVERTDRGGWIVHGRSDTTLNPGGVRIGTAEIYRQVETLDEVTDAVVIGQRWDGDLRVVLFVVLREGLDLGDSLRDRIRTRIRDGTTPRHVPALVLQVPDVPRTASGKVSEMAVHRAVHGQGIPNRTTLANPESLRHFERRPELSPGD